MGTGKRYRKFKDHMLLHEEIRLHFAKRSAYKRSKGKRTSSNSYDVTRIASQQKLLRRELLRRGMYASIG